MTKGLRPLFIEVNMYILVIWTIVAATTGNLGTARDWRPIGEFSGSDMCHKAAADLGRRPDTYRCLRKGD